MAIYKQVRMFACMSGHAKDECGTSLQAPGHSLSGPVDQEHMVAAHARVIQTMSPTTNTSRASAACEAAPSRDPAKRENAALQPPALHCEAGAGMASEMLLHLGMPKGRPRVSMTCARTPVPWRPSKATEERFHVGRRTRTSVHKKRHHAFRVCCSHDATRT